MISNKTLNLIALASLAYGGFILLTYAAIIYSAFWRVEFLPELSGFRHGPTPNPIGEILSPVSLAILITGLAFIANGYLLMKHLRESEVKQTKEFVISSILTDEEKAVYKALSDNNGMMTQKEMAGTLGFSAVKTHRLISRLQEKKIVKTYPFGMTNKVVLEKN